MSDEHYNYNRLRAAGAFPWELEDSDQEHTSVDQPDFLHDSLNKDHTKKNGAQLEPLPENFTPSHEIINYLLNFQKIPKEFIDTQLVDFKLYWHETGESRKAWQNKFKSHVIYRWKKEENERYQNSHTTTIEQLTDNSWDKEDWLEQQK